MGGEGRWVGKRENKAKWGVGRCDEIVGEERYLLEQLDIVLHASHLSHLLFFLPHLIPCFHPCLCLLSFSILFSSPPFSLSLLPPLLSPLSFPPFSLSLLSFLHYSLLSLLSPPLSFSLLQEPEIVVHTTSSTATTDHTDNTTSSSSSSSSSSATPAGSHYLSSQLLSEKTKLARKIREYNRKTTPVNHIHIKSASSSVSGGRGRVRGGRGG